MAQRAFCSVARRVTYPPPPPRLSDDATRRMAETLATVDALPVQTAHTPKGALPAAASPAARGRVATVGRFRLAIVWRV